MAEFYGRRYNDIKMMMILLIYVLIICTDSIDSVDQIEYRILTDDVYSLCGVTSAGFCNLVSQ